MTSYRNIKLTVSLITFNVQRQRESYSDQCRFDIPLTLETSAGYRDDIDMRESMYLMYTYKNIAATCACLRAARFK